MLNCGETTIFRALEFHNIQRRSSRENQNPLYGKEPGRDELIELHYKNHKSINAIARSYKTSWGNIRKLFENLNIKTKTHDEIIRPNNFLEPTKEQLFNWIWKDGLTTSQISGHLKITSATVRNICQKLKIPMKKIIKDKKSVGYWTKEKIITEIQEIEKSQNKISARYISLNKGKLFKGALKEFGTWGNAVDSAGINY
jgi:hypothetical protein